MSTVQTVVLDRLPSLSTLYVNAAATAAKRRMRGRRPGTALPAASHEARDIRADVGKLTAFQHLVGESAGDALPAGFIHAMAFPVAMSVMNRDDFPLPLLGMVHLKNSVQQRSRIPYTQSLDIKAWAGELRGHRAGTQLDVLAEVRAHGTDEVLWRGVSTYLAKGVFLPGIDKVPMVEPLADFRTSDPTALWRLGLETGREYAAVSGDFNPIHLSVLSAKALGMRRSIAHGMYLASRALAGAGVKAESFTWEVSFEAPVYLPARVALDVNITRSPSGIWERSGFEAWNPQSGRRHFSGRAVVL